ncbi:hypothetical protein Y88_3266 [Novosphingobium nitrogenifigens DSM 19370]|uniref:ASCH domain-containing protein n=1 Tax=Novosphingobium nitrogenifigens DSM 19370 TaxID=983920 RepID=F1ZBY8_9SPHN|nr:hypothetical protein Y88_3266 [Novosphingobium nitrogenifigens DSM 19370]
MVGTGWGGKWRRTAFPTALVPSRELGHHRAMIARLIADPAMARAFLSGAKRQVRVPLASPLASLAPGAVVAVAEAVVPGRFASGGEVATDLRRAGHVAFADGWRRDREGAMWQGRPILDAAEKWLAAVHMPDWACRVRLEITGVRREALQAITMGDARGEGHRGLFPRRAFVRWWDCNHPLTGLRWADGPEVVVLEVQLALGG